MVNNGLDFGIPRTKRELIYQGVIIHQSNILSSLYVFMKNEDNAKSIDNALEIIKNLKCVDCILFDSLVEIDDSNSYLSDLKSVLVLDNEIPNHTKREIQGLITFLDRYIDQFAKKHRS